MTLWQQWSNKKVNFTKVRGRKITAVKKALIPSGIPTLETQHHTHQWRDIKITNKFEWPKFRWQVTMVTSGASPSSAVAMSVASLRGATGILSHHPPLPSTICQCGFWSKLFCVFLVAGCFWVELRNGEIDQHAKAPPQILGRLKRVSWENNDWWRRDTTTQESVQIKRIVKRKMSLENGLVEDKSASFWFKTTAISNQTRGIQGTSGRLCAFDCRWGPQNLSWSGIFWMKLGMIQCIYVWFCSCLYYIAKRIQEPCGLKPSGSPRWKPFAVGLSASAE